MARKRRSTTFACLTLLACIQPAGAWAQEVDEESIWSYGIRGGSGYFNFRNSLYVDREPDSPGNLGEDWLEFFIEAWVDMEVQSGNITWFGKASWDYVRTDNNAAEISGGAADSAAFDDAYVGLRIGNIEDGQFEIAAGRYAYQLANGYLLSDGTADGGSRGGYWSNLRKAWAPGGRIQYRRGGHMIEAIYLDRDERPESAAETTITGANYEWLSADDKWSFGASLFGIDANEARAHLDGAKVYNLRAYVKPFDLPLGFEAEVAREDNGLALDSHAWYIMADYAFAAAGWQPILQYRYAFYEGDDPDTLADESFDPLFPGFRDWGTWWQGEIAGEYFLSNSNLKTHMLHLSVQPTENIRTGLLVFNYKLDQPGSYQGGVTSSNLGKETNWYMDWEAFDYVSFSFIIARNEPGTAVQQGHDRGDPFKYAMIYAVFSWEH